MENVIKAKRKLQIFIFISLVLTIITSVIDLLFANGSNQLTKPIYFLLYITLVLLIVPLTVIIIPQKAMLYVIIVLQAIGYLWLSFTFDAFLFSFIPWIINFFVIIYANDFIRLTNEGKLVHNTSQS